MSGCQLKNYKSSNFLYLSFFSWQPEIYSFWAEYLTIYTTHVNDILILIIIIIIIIIF